MQGVNEDPAQVGAGEYFLAGSFTEEGAEQMVELLLGHLQVADLYEHVRLAAVRTFMQIAMLRRSDLALRVNPYASVDEWQAWEADSPDMANPPGIA
jgi:hypothetical protein